MQSLLILFLAILPLIVHARDPNFLAVTEGEPSSLIEGCVSAITGNLYFEQEDVTVQGYIPLKLPRRYISGDGKDENWFFFNHLDAIYHGGETHHTITVKETNGSTFSFQAPAAEVIERFNKHEKKKHKKKHKKEAVKHPIKFRPLLEQMVGATNTSQGEISGQTNLKNALIRLEDSGTHFTLYCPDGTARSYKVHHHKKHLKDIFHDEEEKKLKFLLESETLLTGHQVIYNYDHEDRITSIRTTSPGAGKTYASTTFNYHHKHKGKAPNVDVHTSDGRVLQYRYEEKHDGFFLTSVTGPQSPQETLLYHPKASWGGTLLSRRTLPGLRYCDIDYYMIGHNKDFGIDLKIKDKDDPRFLRVKMLRAPVGADTTGHPTSRIFYYPDQRFTDVRAIDHALVRYRYSEAMRLISIERFQRVNNSDTLFNVETFEWNPSGDLLSRTFNNAANQPLLSRRFSYDERGNVTEETLRGNLSGGNANETYTIKRQYNEQNLLVREEEQNGKITHYGYLPGTALITCKLVCSHNQIVSRLFNDYNGDRVLIREIVDNGSTADANNLSSVTTRTIKSITPMPAGPFIDMPYVIEEKFWDGSQEVLLKKRVLSYTTGGKIAQEEVYDASGNFRYTLKTSYDHLGRPIQKTDPLGQMETFAYDEAGNLVEVKNARTTTFMTYDFMNRLIQSKEIGDDGIEKAVTHTYDGKNNKTSTTDAHGNTTRYVYDSYGHLLETHLPAAPINGTFSTAVLGAAYDGAGREISQTNAAGAITTNEYNIRNQITCTRYPDGTNERWIYNLDGSLKTHIDQEGNKTEYTYDVFGRVTSITDPLGRKETRTYDAFRLLSATDAQGVSTTYTYDKAGRKIAEEKAGEKITYSYDELGRLHTVKTGDLLSITVYDLLDQVIEERQEDTQGQLFFKVSYTYDSAGDRKSNTCEIMGQEAKETFSYDSFHRLITQTNPLGFTTQIHYDDKFVNEFGQRVLQKTTVDPLGQKQIETFSAKGARVSLEKKNSQEKTLSHESFTYDADDHLTFQTSTILPQAATVVTAWEYDKLGRQIALTEAANTSTPKLTRTTYTPTGRTHQIIKPDGVVLEHQYDKAGNLLSLTSSDRTVDYAYEYNNIDALIQALDRVTGIATIRTYDEHGRLITEELGSHLILKNAYDAQGRRILLTIPDGSSIAYHYDALHLREVVRQDANGQAFYAHRYHQYDLSGNLLSQELFCGENISTTFDLLGRKSEINSRFFSQNALEYDPVGNLLKQQIQSRTIEYAYDDLYQLIEEKEQASADVHPFDFNLHIPPHVYSYDSHNNRLEKDGDKEAINALNQLQSFIYDTNGNPIQHADTHYRYDALDRLIAVEEPNRRFRFTYDAFHRRLSKVIYILQNNEWQEQERLHFLYDGQNEIGATDTKATITELRILGRAPQAEIGAAVAMELDGQLCIPLHDLQGNVVTLLTPNGQILEQCISYDAFGNSPTRANPWGPNATKIDKHTINDNGRIYFIHTKSPWRFASKRVDETGLIYYGRRYYDPSFGRWLTPDPLGLSAGVNLYAFVENNPLTHWDLYGLTTEGEPGWISTPWTGEPHVINSIGRPRSDSSSQKPSKQLASTPSRTGSARSNTSRAGTNTTGPSYARSALQGISHGVVDYVVGSLHDLQTAALHMGAGELDISFQERMGIIQNVQNQQASQMRRVDSWMIDMLAIDPSSTVYQSFRSKTRLGLEVGSLVTGGYGVVKGVMAFNRLAKVPAQATRLIKSVRKAETFVNRGTSFAGSKRAPLNYAPYQKIRNESAIINGRKYTGHALDRMQDRGFMPSVIENTVNTGRISPADFSRSLEYYDSVNKIRAIVGENGQIITIIPGRG